jgi:peptidoglycan/xylan/chitin deacetylase (PgdA/CDA1 family)
MRDRDAPGMFVISLDFELLWGVRDIARPDHYKPNLLRGRAAIPALLQLFDKHKIHATWATVGFLFCETRDELLRSLPARLPSYANPRFSPYADLEWIGYDEREDPLHYAPSLIRMIKSFPGQEIGTHTFSHYYCLETGQDADTFRADLAAAVRVAKKFGLTLESFVFPRNQYNVESVSVLRETGIKSYRGKQGGWIYQARNQDKESLFRRGVRLLDAYVRLAGRNCHSLQGSGHEYPINIPPSRFLRPYSPRLESFERLRLRRILSDLSYAARNGLLYHLWWHPHNFGVNLKNNLTFLSQILRRYSELRETFGMESLSMREVAVRVRANGVI